MVKIENLTKEYRYGSCVLENFNLEISDEEFLIVLGPSGCGKTTLLNMIAGFVLPSSGSIFFNGKRVEKPSSQRGVVFQDSNLFPWLNVKKNVLFGLNFKKMDKEEASETADYYLRLVGMEEYSNYYPKALSGGMKQRVSIARVLALKPGLLLMDEPFSALDANTREHLQDELLRIQKTYKKTVFYVTHSVEEAAYLGDRVIIMGKNPGNIFFDQKNPLQGQRKRSSQDLRDYTDFLRDKMKSLPCCCISHN